jgi:hypothetical protein
MPRMIQQRAECIDQLDSFARFVLKLKLKCESNRTEYTALQWHMHVSTNLWLNSIVAQSIR